MINDNSIYKTTKVRFLFLCFIFFSFSFYSIAQHKEKIYIGINDTINSKSLKEQRALMIHIPDSYDSTSKNQQYPVLYLLDGEIHFQSLVGIIRHLNNLNACPEMIVVGISNKNRFKDLLPQININNPYNLDDFSYFLKNELIPYIDKNYPSAPYNILVGHSLGGLRTVNTMMFNNELFNSYIAVDPSLSFNNNQWLNLLIEYKDKIKISKNHSIFLGMAHTIGKDLDTGKILLDTNKSSLHMRTILKFKNILNESFNQNINSTLNYYKNETHGSVTFISFYDGLKELFKWYDTKQINHVYEKYILPDSAAKIVKNHFKIISDSIGYEIKPTIQYVNTLGDYFQYTKEFAKSIIFYKMNYDNFPNNEFVKFKFNQNKYSDKLPISDLIVHSKKFSNFKNKLNELILDPSKSDYDISEMNLNNFGYELLKKNKLEYAHEIFKFNCKIYPNSFNTYDSLGECLLLMGNKSDAIIQYQKSLQINPNNLNAQSKIKMLEIK